VKNAGGSVKEAAVDSADFAREKSVVVGSKDPAVVALATKIHRVWQELDPDKLVTLRMAEEKESKQLQGKGEILILNRN